MGMHEAIGGHDKQLQTGKEKGCRKLYTVTF